MSVNISVKDAIKRYGDNTVIPNLSVEIKEGEFFTLLGPSGCGKTTLLRRIAGFNSIEGGDFNFNEQRINDMEPSKRNIGMVFQNYAIFPHLTVRQNIAFGLTNRNKSKEEIKNEVDEILKTMQIEEYADRLPEKLSGGQQQRVALARAIVIKPNVLLMDEPLSNLDAKLRVDMRTAIKEIQQEVNITTVYVTHDQEEAMSVSDRIAVMNLGEIQHIGTPQNIYHRPANEFVANFIGRSNIIDAKLNGEHIEFDKGITTTTDHIDFNELRQSQMDVRLSIRPEEFFITKEETALHGVVLTSTFLGLNTHYRIELNTGDIVDVVMGSSLTNFYSIHDEVNVGIENDKINIFTQDGKENLVKGVINDAAA